jgi:hypothetical protein
MKIKHKYLELEDKLEEKMLNDHYIDVLKKHIEDLQVLYPLSRKRIASSM